MPIHYYRELETGDYLSVNTETRQYYKKLYKVNRMEGRATAIAGDPSSLCTTGINQEYLDSKCIKIRKNQVPAKWLSGL